jgi:hypothetical protein
MPDEPAHPQGVRAFFAFNAHAVGRGTVVAVRVICNEVFLDANNDGDIDAYKKFFCRKVELRKFPTLKAYVFTLCMHFKLSQFLLGKTFA